MMKTIAYLYKNFPIHFTILLVISIITISYAAEISRSENFERSSLLFRTNKMNLKNSHSHHLNSKDNYYDSNDDSGGDNLYTNNDNDSSSDKKHNNLYPSLWNENENFILTDYLTDGELERRIFYNGITAKETSIGYNSSDLLSLWQVSDGKKFIQLIYSNGRDLIDCEYVHQKDIVRKFLYDFYMDIEIARSRNFTSSSSPSSIDRLITSEGILNTNNDNELKAKSNAIRLMTSDFRNNNDDDDDDDNNNEYEDRFNMRNLHYQKIERYNDIPEGIRQWLNYNELRLECYRRHQQMKSIIQGLNSDDENVRRDANKHLQRKKRDLSDWLIAPNTKWCGKGHSAGKYNQLGGASTADKCCRKHDHCKLNIQGLTTKWQVFNYFPFTISHCSCDMRHRRDLSNLLRVPGTKWCGKGYSALKYSELGGYSKADRCCRQHDKSCPFWIMGFETKYGLFNWRVSTLMHCKCDERFRTCLKMADSADANMVGKLFFNIVQTKCFVLKTEKICKKHSWWGKCEKRVKRKRAHLRDNRKF